MVSIIIFGNSVEHRKASRLKLIDGEIVLIFWLLLVIAIKLIRSILNLNLFEISQDIGGYWS